MDVEDKKSVGVIEEGGEGWVRRTLMVGCVANLEGISQEVEMQKKTVESLSKAEALTFSGISRLLFKVKATATVEAQVASNKVTTGSLLSSHCLPVGFELCEKVAGEWNELSSQTRPCCCQQRAEPARTLWLLMMLRALHCPGASVNSVSRLVTCLPSAYEERRPEETFHKVTEESLKIL